MSAININLIFISIRKIVIMIMEQKEIILKYFHIAIALIIQINLLIQLFFCYLMAKFKIHIFKKFTLPTDLGA